MPQLNVNKLVMAGRMGSDPESKAFPQGGGVISFQFGFTEGSFKDKASGQWKYKGGWITVKKFYRPDTKIDYIMSLAKGMNVLVEGKLGYEEWTTQDGQKRNKVTIVADRVQGVSVDGSQAARSGGAGSNSNYDSPEPDEDAPGGPDEIPF